MFLVFLFTLPLRCLGHRKSLTTALLRCAIMPDALLPRIPTLGSGRIQLDLWIAPTGTDNITTTPFPSSKREDVGGGRISISALPHGDRTHVFKQQTPPLRAYQHGAMVGMDRTG